MLRICILGSGSSGNSTLISTEKTHILIDLGLSTRRVVSNLVDLGISPEQLSCILISHEHTDHIKGLPTFFKRFATPIYASADTAEVLQFNGSIDRFEFFRSGQAFEVGNLEIIPFPVSHDAVDPSGFLIRSGGVQIAHATDLGCITEAVRHRMRDSQCLIIESNHDEAMLKIGPYPWPLKQRVMSRLGHLSNRDLADFLQNEFDGTAQHIFLAHLSLKNNHPEIARMSADDALSKRSFVREDGYKIILTEQNKRSPMIQID